MSKTILIIEPGKECAEFLKEYLQKYYSCDVYIATNGMDAIDQMKKNPDFTLIIMEIILSGGDNDERCRQFNQFRIDTICPDPSIITGLKKLVMKNNKRLCELPQKEIDTVIYKTLFPLIFGINYFGFDSRDNGLLILLWKMNQKELVDIPVVVLTNRGYESRLEKVMKELNIKHIIPKDFSVINPDCDDGSAKKFRDILGEII